MRAQCRKEGGGSREGKQMGEALRALWKEVWQAEITASLMATVVRGNVEVVHNKLGSEKFSIGNLLYMLQRASEPACNLSGCL